MKPVQHLDLAVIGDEELANGMRLAGVSRYYVVENSRSSREDVRRALTTLISEANVGIVAIQEDYVEYVEDLIAQVKEKERTTPVIIEVPSKYGTKYGDVAEYYRAYIRKFIGFDVSL